MLGASSLSDKRLPTNTSAGTCISRAHDFVMPPRISHRPGMGAGINFSCPMQSFMGLQ